MCKVDSASFLLTVFLLSKKLRFGGLWSPPNAHFTAAAAWLLPIIQRQVKPPESNPRASLAPQPSPAIPAVLPKDAHSITVFQLSPLQPPLSPLPKSFLVTPNLHVDLDNSSCPYRNQFKSWALWVRVSERLRRGQGGCWAYCVSQQCRQNSRPHNPITTAPKPPEAMRWCLLSVRPRRWEQGCVHLLETSRVLSHKGPPKFHGTQRQWDNESCHKYYSTCWDSPIKSLKFSWPLASDTLTLGHP